MIVERARLRGDLPSMIAPDTVADIVFGVVWYRLLATDRPIEGSVAEDLIAVLVPGERYSVAAVPSRIACGGVPSAACRSTGR